MNRTIFLNIIFTFFFLTIQTTICHASSTPPYISEIFPNPKGQDLNQEWLEIQNPQNSNLFLNNWKLIINKKEIKIPNTTIPPMSTKIIQENIKLNNTSEEIVLLNDKNQIIQKINYESAKENLSYSRILFEEKNTIYNQWIWTFPSKNQINPKIEIKDAEVFITPQIHENLIFYIKIKNKIEKIIIPDENTFEFLSKTLKKNQNIKIYIQKRENQNILFKTELQNNIEKENKTKNPIKTKSTIIIYSIIPITIILSLLYKKSSS